MTTPRNTAPAMFRSGEARGGVQFGVQEHAVDDEPHEQRLDHFQPGGDEREARRRRPTA